MKPEVSSTRPRTTLAPFVGVALAALTIGSLVTFSLVAQRASLEGFSARGVTADAPVAASPESIVVPATPAPSSNAGAQTTEAPPATPVPAPTGAALLVSAPDATTTATTPTATPSASAASGRDPDAPSGRPTGNLPAGPIAASLSDDGHSRAEEAHTAQKPKHPNKSEEVRSTGSRGSEPRANGGGRPEHAGPPSPKPKPKPARAAKPQHTPVAKGHVKAKGQGHHKDRGRGHDKD